MSDGRDFRLLMIISFRIKNATKLEVFRFLSRDERIGSFIIGEENNGDIIGVIYTPKRTAISTLEPRFLKLDKKRQGHVVLKPEFDFSERIMSVDPMWMVKGDRWPASDLVGGAPGSIVPCIVPQVGPSGVMPVDPIPLSTIQTILSKLEGLESRLGVFDAVPVNIELSTENERIKREKEELKEENESLKVQLAETRESTEGGESKYLETIGKLKEDNIRVKRQNKDLEQRLREADYQIQRVEQEAMATQRTILELQDKIKRLEKNLASVPVPAPAPAPAPARVSPARVSPARVSPARPRVETPRRDFEIQEIKTILAKLLKGRYPDNPFRTGGGAVPYTDTISSINIEKANADGSFIIRVRFVNPIQGKKDKTATLPRSNTTEREIEGRILEKIALWERGQLN